jgi:hypothetical protein|tara:strand:- start:1532 stop:2641 length:1110 start_codon:yes stop_codon:yes gene_type:complete
MNIDSIIAEWTYRLEKGYPDCPEDYIELRNVLRERTDLSINEQDAIVRRAMGLEEQEDDVESDDLVSKKEQQRLITYIETNYKFNDQSINNLDFFSIKILESEFKQQLLEIIYSNTPYYNLERGDIRITGNALELYNICSIVKVPNGHWSELFFALMFKGRVKGGVAGDDNNIKSDVELNNPKADISVKSYIETTYDCGTLPAGTYTKLKKFIALSELLTGIDVQTASLSTIEINKILKELESERLQDEIKEILKQEDSSFAILRNAAKRIRDILGNASPDYLENVIDSFCNDLDNTLQIAFVDKIDWWALFNRNNNTLFLRPSAEIYEAVRCRKEYPRISNAIPNFHQGKVWLKGTAVGVTKKQYKDE